MFWLIGELIVAVLIIAFCIYQWFKTRSMDKALKTLGLTLPWLKEMAAKTETEIDDNILAYIALLVGYDSPNKVKKAKEKIDNEIKSWENA